MDQPVTKYSPQGDGLVGHDTPPILEPAWKPTASVASSKTSRKAKSRGCLSFCCSLPSEMCQCCCALSGRVLEGRGNKLAMGLPLVTSVANSTASRGDISVMSSLPIRVPHGDAVHADLWYASRVPTGQCYKPKQPFSQSLAFGNSALTAQNVMLQPSPATLPQSLRGWQYVGPYSSTQPQGMVAAAQHECLPNAGGCIHEGQLQPVTLLLTPRQAELLQLLFALQSGAGSPKPGCCVERGHGDNTGHFHPSGGFIDGLPASLLAGTGSAAQGQTASTDDTSQQRCTLQTLLYHRAQRILSPSELHLLRHVLCLERLGPLDDCAVSLLQSLTNRGNAEPLSVFERQSFVDLLKQHPNETLLKSQEQLLKTLLVKALASSLSPEQEKHAGNSLQEKYAPPFSAHTVEGLENVLKMQVVSGNELARIGIQAAVEEQLKPYCTRPQQLAIHRLLFLEQPWHLSSEQRDLLETLIAQPAAWWSPAQKVEFFESISPAEPRRSFTSGPWKPARLLLQLLRSTLTPYQNRHLSVLLNAEDAVQSAEATQPTSFSPKQLVPSVSQQRLMTLIRQALGCGNLTTAENREMHAGILQELARLVPEEQLGALNKLILLDDRPLPPMTNLEALKELLQAHESLKVEGGTPAFAEPLDNDGLRKAFIRCLAISLSPQQLSLLKHMLQTDSRTQREEECLEAEGDWTPQQSTSSAHAGHACGGNSQNSRPVPTSGRGKYDAMKDVPQLSNCLQKPLGGAMTEDQAELLAHLLQLHYVGCLPPERSKLLTELLEGGHEAGLASDEHQQLLLQLLLRQLSATFSKDQLRLIEELVDSKQVPASQSSAHSHSSANQTGDGRVPESYRDIAACLTPDQRHMLEWLTGRHKEYALGKQHQLPCGQLAPCSEHGTPEGEPQPPQQLMALHKLASTLSPEQLEMILRLLDHDWSHIRQSIPASSEVNLESNGMSWPPRDVGAGQQTALPSVDKSHPERARGIFGASDSWECSRPCEEHKAAEVMLHETPSGAREPGSEVVKSARELPTLLRGLQEREVFAISPASQQGGLNKGVDESLSHMKIQGLNMTGACSPGAGGQTDPSQQLAIGNNSQTNLNPALTSSLEDLQNKRVLVEQLALEAADQKGAANYEKARYEAWRFQLFREDLKVWRQQCKQRAELQEVLKPFIAKMEAIQSGYVKRCPCLYHQQQDQREREERQANLQLLNALGSFHCGPQGQAVGGAATSLADNTSIDEPAPAGGCQDVKPHGEQGDMADGRCYSFGTPSPELAFAVQNTQLLDALSGVAPVPCRVGSLPISLPSHHNRPGTQKSIFLRASNGGAASSNESLEGTILHTGSLGALPLTAHGGGNRPATAALRRGNAPRSSTSISLGCDDRGEHEMAMEERKKISQQQALEKARQLKEDAKVASWIVLRKQIRPGEPAADLDLVDKINISHLKAKTLPKGKAWKTQSLLRMIEGIVGLVATLRAEPQATSLLTPLLALANQARVEDCDLAVHAEIEGVRRASLHLTQPTNASDVDIKKPKGGGAGAQQTAYGEEEGRAGKDASGTKGRTRESHQAEKAKRKSNASRSASKPPPAASAQKSRHGGQPSVKSSTLSTQPEKGRSRSPSQLPATVTGGKESSQKHRIDELSERRRSSPPLPTGVRSRSPLQPLATVTGGKESPQKHRIDELSERSTSSPPLPTGVRSRSPSQPLATVTGGKESPQKRIEEVSVRSVSLSRQPTRFRSRSPSQPLATMTGGKETPQKQHGDDLLRSPTLSPPLAKFRSRSPQKLTTMTGGKEPTTKQQMRVRRKSELITALEMKAKELLQRKLRKQSKVPLHRTRSALISQTNPQTEAGLLTAHEELRKWHSDNEDFRTLRRAFGPIAEPVRRRSVVADQKMSLPLEESLRLPPDVPFVIFREKLKRWLLSEGKGLELVNGETMRYKQWLKHYNADKKLRDSGGFDQTRAPQKVKVRPQKVAMRRQRWSMMAGKSADVQGGENSSVSQRGVSPSAAQRYESLSPAQDGGNQSPAREGETLSPAQEGETPSAAQEGETPSAAQEEGAPSPEQDGETLSAAQDGVSLSVAQNGDILSEVLAGEDLLAAQGVESLSVAHGVDNQSAAKGGEIQSAAQGGEIQSPVQDGESLSAAEGGQTLSAAQDGEDLSGAQDGENLSAMQEGTNLSAAQDGDLSTAGGGEILSETQDGETLAAAEDGEDL